MVAQPGSVSNPVTAAMQIHLMEGIDLIWLCGTRIFRELRFESSSVEQGRMIVDCVKTQQRELLLQIRLRGEMR